MNYKLENLTSREFEVLAANYVKNKAPEYQWKLTKKTVDFNRDFEADYDDLSKWGEAKLTKKPSTSVSKSRWDPTLLSAVLKNNVDEIYLITCGWIPLEYIVRAEHFKNKTIKKIHYINRHLLNIWLQETISSFDDFGDNEIELFKALKRAGIEEDHVSNNSKVCLINAYDIISNSLEPTNIIETSTLYEINITMFSNEETHASLEIPRSFVITKTKYNNLSCSADKSFNLIENKSKVTFQVGCGYSQLRIYGLFDSLAKNKENFNLFFNGKKYKKILQISKLNFIDNNRIVNIEKAENALDFCFNTGSNSVVQTQSLRKNDLIKEDYLESNREYNYFSFKNSIFDNAIVICKIISKLLLGINCDKNEETALDKTINNTLVFCPFWLSNVFIGTSSYIFAVNSLKYLSENLNVLKECEFKNNFVKSVIFIDNYQFIPNEFKEVLFELFAIFKSKSFASIIIINSNSFDKEFEHHEINPIESIYNKQTLSNNDFMLVKKRGDYHYEQSEFYKAKFFYEIIYNKYDNISTLCPEYVFNYADCLNHCGSMRKSQELFEIVVKSYKQNNNVNLKLLLEAETELINLKFWNLDTFNLIYLIDTLLNTYKNELINDTGDKRDKYAFYNCLNRKMVTQYLLGEYCYAEKTFNEYVSLVDSNYENYLAFAYMDSARGLYSYNLNLAKKRLDKAFEILTSLFHNGREKRRYFDCLVEKEYVKFIMDFENGNNPSLEPLISAIANVRNCGYKNMLIKCYLKLATCHLAKRNTDSAVECLNFVKLNCDFSENTRALMLYNKILSSLYEVENSLLIKSKPIADNYAIHKFITFNPKQSSNKILLESRIW